MEKIRKEDCMTIDEAIAETGYSKSTIYNYMNAFNLDRHKFRFDRRTYIAKSDVTRIKEFIRENRR